MEINVGATGASYRIELFCVSKVEAGVGTDFFSSELKPNSIFAGRGAAEKVGAVDPEKADPLIVPGVSTLNLGTFPTGTDCEFVWVTNGIGLGMTWEGGVGETDPVNTSGDFLIDIPADGSLLGEAGTGVDAGVTVGSAAGGIDGTKAGFGVEASATFGATIVSIGFGIFSKEIGLLVEYTESTTFWLRGIFLIAGEYEPLRRCETPENISRINIF